jgi:hypothetical protein
MDKDQWWSAISPEQREIYYYNQQNAARNVYCVQRDGANLPNALPVNIWTMQCLLCEEPQESFPLRATVRKTDNTVRVAISNVSQARIEKGYVLLKGSQVFEFGGVEPMSTKEFEGRLGTVGVWGGDAERQASQYNETLQYARSLLNNEEAYSARGCIGRTNALRAMLERGAAVVCVETNTQDAPVRIRDKTCEYSNRGLYRLVIIPEQL